MPAPTSGSLVDQAYAALYGRILRCELAPGARLSERKLATELGLGLAPVRAALARLAARGLLEATPRVGYTVRGFTVKSINDFFQAWRMLGPEIARLATAKLTDEDIEGLHRLQEQVSGDARFLSAAEGWVSMGEALFDELVRILDNELISDFYRRMRFDLHRLFVLTLREDARGLEGAFDQDTSRIYSRDAEVAATAVREFVDTTHRSVLITLVAGGLVDSAQVDFATRRSPGTS